MGSEWQEISLADCLEFVVDNRGKTAPVEETGIPLIATNCISNSNTYPVYERVRYVSEDTYANWFRAHPKPGDIILTNKGSQNGAVCLVPDPVDFCIAQDMVALRANEKVVDPLYLFAALRSDLVQSRIKNLNVDAVIPHFKKTDFDKLLIPCPSREYQQFIGNNYFNFCQKIELNRQAIITLESMAQVLFKSWFVDFDPVIDNALAAGNAIPNELQTRAEKRQAFHVAQAANSGETSLPAEIQQLFPSSFVFTEEMGWVPEGWSVSTIGDVVETTGGGTPSTKNPEFWDGGIHPFCTPKDMSQLNSWVLMDTERHLTDAGVNKISSGQLPAGTVLMSSRAPIGYLAISDVPVSVNQGIIAMLPTSDFSPLYLLSWTLANMGNITDRANGSTFLEISKKNFRPIPFLVPSHDVVSVFNAQSKAIQEKMLLLAEQVSSLTKVRDSLLPKLLSGQLRLPDAEQQIAEVL